VNINKVTGSPVGVMTAANISITTNISGLLFVRLCTLIMPLLSKKRIIRGN
jgi:hypothetical protein